MEKGSSQKIWIHNTVTTMHKAEIQDEVCLSLMEATA